MNKNEIRVGNIVKYYAKEDPIVILDITTGKKKKWFDGYVRYKENSKVSIVCIKGIPLSKEWFKKLGFIEYENEYDTTYEIEIKDGYKLESVKSLTYTSFLLREINNVTGDQLFFLPHNIEYVHQLQNLYFSLSGKELTFDVS